MSVNHGRNVQMLLDERALVREVTGLKMKKTLNALKALPHKPPKFFLIDRKKISYIGPPSSAKFQPIEQCNQKIAIMIEGWYSTCHTPGSRGLSGCLRIRRGQIVRPNRISSDYDERLALLPNSECLVKHRQRLRWPYCL
jgi:hypothetical protein